MGHGLGLSSVAMRKRIQGMTCQLMIKTSWNPPFQASNILQFYCPTLIWSRNICRSATASNGQRISLKIQEGTTEIIYLALTVVEDGMRLEAVMDRTESVLRGWNGISTEGIII